MSRLAFQPGTTLPASPRCRPSHQDRRPIQLHEIVENTLTLLRASFPKNIDIHLAVPPSQDTILADPTQIEQVVMNLCVNAAYAIGEHHGIVGIGIDHVEGARTTHPVPPGLAPPATDCLTISDTGCGIAPEIRDKIWEPFFSTKGDRGNGLGLDLVKQLVTAQHGRIVCESTVGVGTQFTITLPQMADPNAMTSTPALAFGG